MTSPAAVTEQPGATVPGDLFRVAVRELRETTWRALYAAGASAGEASVASSAVAFSEVHRLGGLDAVLAELPLVPTSRVPVSVHRGPVDRLDDPARRGLLLLAPLGIGLVVSRPVSTPVILQGLGWHPVLAGVIARHCRPGDPALVALDVGDDGVVRRGLRVGPDRAVEHLDDDEVAALRDLDRRTADERATKGPEVLLAALSPGGRARAGDVATTAAVIDRERQAHTDGVLVAAPVWAAVHDAAGRYLVPGP